MSVANRVEVRLPQSDVSTVHADIAQVSVSLRSAIETGDRPPAEHLDLSIDSPVEPNGLSHGQRTVLSIREESLPDETEGERDLQELLAIENALLVFSIELSSLLDEQQEELRLFLLEFLHGTFDVTSSVGLRIDQHLETGHSR